jgi:spermidine synthase
MQKTVTALVVLLALGGCTTNKKIHKSAMAEVLPVPAHGVRLTSDYSTILVTQKGTTRTLWFVRDSGEIVLESQMDLSAPHRLLVDYTRVMFASYLFIPRPKRVLIVGVGAGSMVRFLQHHAPGLAVDAVDIDPLVIQVAEKYFGTRPGTRVRLIAADGLKFIRESKQRYDVIYLDAFLKPAADTDPNGMPLQLKTIAFYQRAQKILTARGAVVFNLNEHRKMAQDIKMIRSAFVAAHHFEVPKTGNHVIVATNFWSSADPAALASAAKAMQARFGIGRAFPTYIRHLRKPAGK